ncbi:hypothetical protein VaNZ11_006850 [Volvox africanus]|uniref:Uncharacterized protein n=1 Tax=Volvox africanus TaxID=51714 RepID=A0ABQ5S1M1_9CHLO|nr:hypothetical protein VaNZ11_006850 [Volvox africanus]
MFGIGPIRTRINYADAAPAGLPSRLSVGTGTESALQRTRSLLESATRQHKYVTSNYHLAADLRDDELAALSLLRSLLEELETCIMENENPPASVSKRKALIKVEKARRAVLAAVRECSSHVVESQGLFADIERFIELRPEEPVSPRNFPIKWSRKVPMLRNVPKRWEPTHGRSRRVEDSLVMSIIGLSALAEGSYRGDTPTSDASGPIAMQPPVLAAPKPSSPALPVVRTPLEPTTRHNNEASECSMMAVKDGGDGVAAALAAEAIGNSLSIGAGGGDTIQYDLISASETAAEGAAAAAVSVAKPQDVQNAALLLDQMQMQPPKPAVAADTEDGVRRPSLSYDVAHSGATTMCNIDSCVSVLPPAGSTLTAAAMGGGATESNMQSYAAYDNSADDDDVCDEDEVNSAERDAVSPNHQVSLLGCAKTLAAAATAASSMSKAAAAAAADAASAVTRSTTSTPPSRKEQGQTPGRGELTLSGAGAAVSIVPAGSVAAEAHSVRAGEPRAGSQESLHGNRPQLNSDLRRLPSGSHVVAPAAVMDLPLLDGSRVEAVLAGEAREVEVAAGELGDLGLTVANAAGAATMAAQRLLVPQQPRYVPIMPRQNLPSTTAAAAGSGGGGAAPVLPAAAPQQPYAYANPIGHVQHPAHAAALAAAATHPYGANGFSHPPSTYHHFSPHAAGGAAANLPGVYGDIATLNYPIHHSQPPSLPSSLRGYPVAGPATRPGGISGTAAVAALAAGPHHGRSQPMSLYQSLDSGQFPASAVAWDTVSVADTESGSQRNGRRRRGRSGGLMGLVRHVMGFVGVSVLSGAAIALGAAAVNTGLDEQQAAQQARQRQGSGGRRDQLQRISYGGGNDLIPQRTLQQLRSPDLLALGRG